MSRSAFKTGYDKIDWRPIPPAEPKPVSVRRAGFPCPMVVRSFAQPVQSMADGKWYDTKRDLQKSHEALGKTEIGETPIEGAGMATPDKARIRADLDKALGDVQAGKVSDEIKAIS